MRWIFFGGGNFVGIGYHDSVEGQFQKLLSRKV